jgi:hypothetical protein
VALGKHAMPSAATDTNYQIGPSLVRGKGGVFSISSPSISNYKTLINEHHSNPAKNWHITNNAINK